jgi:hypothetical protein
MFNFHKSQWVEKTLDHFMIYQNITNMYKQYDIPNWTHLQNKTFTILSFDHCAKL